MKTRNLFILFTLAIICFRAKASNDTIIKLPNDTLVVVCAESDCLNDSIQIQSNCMRDNIHVSDLSYSDGISTLTLVIEAIEDMFNRVNIYVTIISVIIALAGFFGIGSIKSKIKKLEKSIQDTKDEAKKSMLELKEEASKLKIENVAIEKVQTLNNQYIQKVNQWMLYNAYTIANTIGGESIQSRNLMEESMLNYYLMKLYLSKDQHEINGCINYIKTKGGIEVIEHLQFIVDNDTDKDKIEKASKAIGYIQGRILK